ncbi:32197_t:CDS:2 [Gigaspora margarita]|uniref:32197_t:CDS:1 n=1 Tax=Gigaspora margarita TaxID=4874 RepID=A0ABN7UTY8_GIGMA|nr:32197_t:CDS:2 [Gigaspora margarita]
MSNQRNRVKKTYTPLSLLRVHTKPAKSYQSSLPISYKLPVNKSNKHSNNLNNLEKLNEHLNDLSNSEQYSNISNDLDQYSSETCQYSSESNKDVDWKINEDEHFLNNINWENNEHTPSNSVSTKSTYSIILVDYIESILNNPIITPYLYFGPGIVCDKKCELWHDKAIKFACVHSVIKVNERQLLRVDLLVLYYGFPEHLRSSNRKTCGMDMELRLVEEQECLIIPKKVTQINVWLKDLDRPVEYAYFVTEILYSFNGQWYIRDLIKRHRAPYEYIPIPPLPP